MIVLRVFRVAGISVFSASFGLRYVWIVEERRDDLYAIQTPLERRPARHEPWMDAMCQVLESAHVALREALRTSLLKMVTQGLVLN